MGEKFLTLHPEGKQGVRIDLAKYEAIKRAILTVLAQGDTTFKDLLDAVPPHLPADWSGSVSWYVVSVKLDLEARDVVRRVPGVKPQLLRLMRP